MSNRHVLAVAAVALAACAGAPAHPQPTTPPAAGAELSPALAPLAWWLGDWDADDGSGSEHWVAAAGAIYGVALHADGGFEIMVVDDGERPGPPDGVLRFLASPGGKPQVEFRAGGAAAADGITFANLGHDDPKSIRYAPEGGALAATLEGERTLRFGFRRGAGTAAPELEAADRSFSADTGARGVEGWVAAFAPDGAMLRPRGRIEGAAIAEAMRPTLTSGTLAWTPIASRRRGDLGFTVGKATFTAARPEDSWRSSYVTLWRRQPDGSWKVLLDTGRVVNEDGARGR